MGVMADFSGVSVGLVQCSNSTFVAYLAIASPSLYVLANNGRRTYRAGTLLSPPFVDRTLHHGGTFKSTVVPQFYRGSGK